jgi:hypothetical protein
MAEPLGRAPQPLSILITGLGFICLVGIIAVSMRPMDTWFLSEGLDPSWVAASAEAQRLGLVFGRDFVFTSGPLSFLYTGFFASDLEPLLKPVKIVFVLSMALFFAVVAYPAQLAKRSLLFLTFFLVIWFLSSQWFVKDAALFLLPWAAAMSMLWRLENRWFLLLGLVLIVVTGAYANAKFTILVLGLASFVVADVYTVVRRSIPVASAVFIAAFLVFYTLSGQPVGAVFEFITSGLAVSSGYSWAMGINGNHLVFALWCLATLGFVVFKALSMEVQWTPRWFIGERRVYEFCLLLGALFISMKQGFVRADLHILQSFYMLMVLVGFELLRERDGRRALLRQGFYVSVVGGCSLLIAVVVYKHTKNFNHVRPDLAIETMVRQFSIAQAFLTDRAGWLEDLNTRNDRQVAAMREKHAMPALEGSVDSIGHSQFRLIANGFDYRPRPTVQEYSTYSTRLIELNRAFFEGDRAPDNLVMHPGSIDGRHPATAEGALWPLLLQRYEPSNLVGNDVYLRLRDKPLESLLIPVGVFEAPVNEWIDLPEHDDPLFIKIEARPTLFGRLMAFLLRPPQLRLDIAYGPGAPVEKYRFIPAIGAAGAVLSPKIATGLDFVLLAAGQLNQATNPLSSRIKIRAKGLGPIAYQRSVLVEVLRLDSEALRLANSKLPAIERAIVDVAPFADLLAQNGISPPQVEVGPEGFFAHAPVDLSLVVNGWSSLSIAFGLREQSYQEGTTDGVCFSVQDAKDRTALFERCLDPKSVLEDQGRQEAFVQLPDSVGRVVLKTDCRGNCSWDWSYWARATQGE